MKHLLAAIAFMLVQIPVNIAIHEHHFWAGAAFGAWGWLAVGAVRWSAR